MKKRVCIVTTTPFIVTAFLGPYIRSLAQEYELTVAVNVRDGYPLKVPFADSVRIVHVPIARKIRLHSDVLTLCRLLRLFVAGRFDAVHTIAPKAGLLGMLAAWLVRTPKRIHTYQGEVWTTKRGAARVVLRALDTLVGKFATHRIVVGRSEQAFLEVEGVLKPGKSAVLGAGSWGVDVNRFKPDHVARSTLRARLSLPDDALVLLFLGRLARDKGILDLARAFAIVRRQTCNVQLILVGPDEERLAGSVRASAGASADRVHLAGYTDFPETWLACADVVCLPSYREGFSTVVLEAAACEAPVVASRIYGTRDALIEGVTGLFHEPGDIEGLATALVSLCSNRELRRHMGQAGRARVIKDFSQERVMKTLLQFYSNALA